MTITRLKSLKLHNGKIWSLDYKTCATSNLLAIASSDHKIRLLEVHVDNVRLIDSLDGSVHTKTVRSVAWRPNTPVGTAVLAAGSFDSTVSIWTRNVSVARGSHNDASDSEEGEEEEDDDETELLAIIEGHENEVKGVAWSYDGMLLATCSRDKSVWIWETDEMGEEYECISVLQEHSQDVKHVVWHPTRNWLASSSYDDTVRVWKEIDDDWECVALLDGHQGTVWCSDFEKMGQSTTTSSEDSSENARLCSCSDDKTVRVWKYMGDSETGDGQQEWICQSVLPSIHTTHVYGVAWSSQTGLIASCGADGTVAVYSESVKDSGDWKIVSSLELAHGVYEINCVKWITVEGKELLVTGGDDGCVNLWNVQINSN